jgi:RHS repeat-associated protein
MDDPSTSGVTEGFGLMFYNARWYDPALGRFAQADTIIPQHQGVQAWDRFAYTNNNPVRYTDPTGHCIGLKTCFLTAIGFLPDFQGVANVVLWTKTDDAVVAAGLAVQSQWSLSMVLGDGLGFAGALESELDEGQNPYSVAVAEEVMSERIDGAITGCDTKCADGVDKLIVAAIAQNGYDLDFSSLPLEPDKTINWTEFFDSDIGSSTSDPFAQIRQEITGMDYSAEFMLKLYIQDLRLLMKLGYKLPSWATEKDVKFIEDHFVAPKDKE